MNKGQRAVLVSIPKPPYTNKKREVRTTMNKEKTIIESGLNFISIDLLLWVANNYALNHELIVENGKIYEVRNNAKR